MLEGIPYFVLQTFFKPYELYKPTSFTNHTNLLLEGIASSVLQTLRTLRALPALQVLQTFTNFTNLKNFTKGLQTLCSKVYHPPFYKPFARRYSILRFTNLLQTLQTLQTFCLKIYHPPFYIHFTNLTNFIKRTNFTKHTKFTNLLLEGIQSLVLQNFFKPYELYKPTGFTNLTNLLLEGIASSVLQTFYKLYEPYKLYKPFARRYTILHFTNILQTLQT